MSAGLDFPDAVPTLRGDTIDLRELTEDDIPAWFERARDVESAAMAGDPVPDSIALGRPWLQRHRDRFRERTGIRWAIVPKGSHPSVGTIGLSIASPDARVADLGFVIARAWWGKGIATAATRKVVRYAFDTLGVVEIRAELLQTNVASRRVLEKSGFHLQSLIPDFDVSEAGAQDGYLFVLHSKE